MTHHPTKILNPFLGLGPGKKTTFKVPYTICSRLAGLHPNGGAVQTLCSILLNKFINELDRIKFNSYDPAGFKSVIDGLTVNVNAAAPDSGVGEGPSNARSTDTGHPSGTIPSLPDKASQGDDGRGVVPMERVPTGPSAASDVASVSKVRRRKGKG